MKRTFTDPQDIATVVSRIGPAARSTADGIDNTGDSLRFYCTQQKEYQTMKDYELKVTALAELESNGRNIMGYYSKGHHDREAFMDAYTKSNPTIPEWVDFTISAEDVEHNWVRLIPYGPDYSLVWTRAETNSRGAFPVTEIDYSNIYISRVLSTIND